MKKVLAIALALCIVFAMGTVAFAAQETVQTDPNADKKAETVLVKTTIENLKPEELDSYTVTIPADVTINWNDSTSKDLSVKITGQFVEGSTIQVTAEALTELKNGDYTMGCTMDAVDTGVKGAADIDGDGFTYKDSINITAEQFAAAPVIGEYSGTINYSVNYTPAV